MAALAAMAGMMARTRLSRLLFVSVGLAIAVPAAAQTRIASVKAAGEIVEAALSSRGERIAARVGRDRIVIWSVPDAAQLQDLQLPAPTAALLFDPAGNLIVALADGAIEVRDAASGRVSRRMEAGARQSVLAVSPDGRLLASSGMEVIRLWDSSGTLLRTFGHAFGNLASLSFSPDATTLVSSGFDTDVHLWDVATGQQKASMRDRLLATFSTAFSGDGKNLVIGGAAGAIEIVDPRTASAVRKLRVEKYAVGQVSVSPDGRSVAAIYFDTAGMSRPAPLSVLDLASGRVLRRVQLPDGPAYTAGFAADGRLLYVTVRKQELTLWAASGGQTTPSSDGAR
jgi:WD40 repeat protein